MSEEKKEKFYQLSFFPKKSITVWQLARAIVIILLLWEIRSPVPGDAVAEIEGDVLNHFKVDDVTEEFKQLREQANEQQDDGGE